MPYQCRSVQRAPRLDMIEAGAILAIDCEGVELLDETSWRNKGCGRVSVVNEREEVVYDTFTYYRRDVRFKIAAATLQPRDQVEGYQALERSIAKPTGD